MPPKFDPNEEKIIIVRSVGGEVAATATLAPKVGPMGLNAKKIGEDIMKATKEWKGLKITCQLVVKNRVAKVNVTPSAASMLIRALSQRREGGGHKCEDQRDELAHKVHCDAEELCGGAPAGARLARPAEHPARRGARRAVRPKNRRVCAVNASNKRLSNQRELQY